LLAVVDGPARAIRAAQLVVEGRALRAAVHTSEVELVDHRPTGPGVGIATAASRVAAPGEVLVSRTVRDLVVGSGIELVARGAFPLGGSAELWELYAPSPAAV
jgi:class 3 adenylate cyclase